MKAAVQTGFGTEETLNLVSNQEVPVCVGEQDVVIKVKACTLSNFDIQLRQGLFKELDSGQGCVGGNEISGVVHAVGNEVSNVKVGDEVVALSPLDNERGGCAEFSLQQSYNVLPKPERLSHEEASASLLPCLQAYTALHYQIRLRPNDTLLFFPPARGSDSIVVQLASLMGGRVIIAVASSEQLNFFADCGGSGVVRVLDLSAGESMLKCVNEETGGLGVQCILDLRDQAETKTVAYPSLPDLISCIAVGGVWCTNNNSLQLDPPHSRALFLRCASLSFLFAPCWLLCPSHQGRFLHVMNAALKQLDAGALASKVAMVLPLEKIRQAHRSVRDIHVGRVVIRPEPPS